MTTNLPSKPEGMPQEFYEACIAVLSKRPRIVIHHILQHGFITTEQLGELYNYDHPPRAIRDVRENGIPLKTYSFTSLKTGRKIAAYCFADPSMMVAGRIGGRKAFSKQFKDRLIEYYGARSALTNEPLEARYLQIDHRIPYEVGGNDSPKIVEGYMLLDASAQRAKSWSCEHCKNFLEIKDPAICGRCFWAFPENYKHVEMREERRLDIVWSGDETDYYDRFVANAERVKRTPQQLIKELVAEFLRRRK
jgi:hypothetical protein